MKCEVLSEQGHLISRDIELDSADGLRYIIDQFTWRPDDVETVSIHKKYEDHTCVITFGLSTNSMGYLRQCLLPQVHIISSPDFPQVRLTFNANESADAARAQRITNVYFDHA